MEQYNKGWFKRALQSICRNKYIWLAFAIAFLPRLFFVLQSVPVSIGGDEIFAMGPAAKLVGYDWSGVMQDYRYYGYGYTVLLIPFFKLIHDPVLLYRMIVLLMALAQSVSAPISYHLMKKYLHVDNEKILCVSSICCSYLVAVRAVYTYPEFIYVLVMWLLAWVLLRMNACVDDKKKKIVHTVLLVLVLFYASTVHSRATAAWLAVAFGIVYYGWVYRKTIVSVPVCLVMGAGAFIVSQKGMEAVLSYVVKASSSDVANTGVSFSLGYLMEDVKSWPAWVNIIIGQMNEAVVVTGGLAVFAVVALLILLWKGLVRAKGEMAEVREAFGKLYLAVCVITALLQGYWVLCILPYISEFNGSCWDFAPYSLTKGFEDVIRLRTYLPATFVVFLILLIGYILYKKNKAQIILGVLCIMLIYCYGYNALYHEGYRGQKNYSYVDDSVKLLKDLEKEGGLPDKIYVEDASVGGIGQQTKYLYQFCMLDKPVVTAEPSENETEAIFLCQNPEEWSGLVDEGYLCGKIAEYEYIYVIGDQLKEMIGETGITLTAGY